MGRASRQGCIARLRAVVTLDTGRYRGAPLTCPVSHSHSVPGETDMDAQLRDVGGFATIHLLFVLILPQLWPTSDRERSGWNR